MFYTLFHTPLGLTGVAATPAGICRVVLSLSSESEFLRTLKTLHPAPQKQPNALARVEKEFHLYFQGRLKRFSCKPDLSCGTRFQQNVWKKLTTIPFGKTRSYKWLAKAADHPQACRAAGNANGRNPVPVIVPCHRVIRQNGDLGGFTGGVHLKRFLLDLETKSHAAL
ncbi:MAG: methylated-DNA--[protein]-cysteine S-methyltransferase [Nitrospinae bacterium]|nr:methylated-DNA--[protein]-cysteine S-methyltransferase [Nitrospinota bacterium]